MMKTERDPIAQHVERGGEGMSFRSVSGCQVMSNSCPTLVKWVPVIFSDWTMWRVLTQNPVLGLETINHSSHWGRIKAGSGRPLQLLSQSRCLCTQVPHPHKVFILPSCTFYLSVSNISSENLNEISQCVLEGAFLFSNVLIRRRQWHPTPVLLPGKSHGRRSLVGCSPWGRKESDMTERFHFHFSLSCLGEGNGNPLQCAFLENPRDGGAWWAAVYGVTQSQTLLK